MSHYHGIGADLNVAVNAGDANHLSQAVPDSPLRRRLRSLQQATKINPETLT